MNLKTDEASVGRMVEWWRDNPEGTLKDCGRELGFPPTTVRACLCRAGAYEGRDSNRMHATKPSLRRRMVEWWDAHPGAFTTDCAAACGVSPATARKVLTSRTCL